MSDTPDLPFVLICESCGRPGARLSRRPQFGEPVTSEIAYHMDGRKVGAMSKALCDACGEALWRSGFLFAGTPKTTNVRDASDYDIEGAPV